MNLAITRHEETSCFRSSTPFSCEAGNIAILGVGIIVMLGGVFAILAAYQILPDTVNVISQSGLAGIVVSYVTFGVGTATVIIAIFRSRPVVSALPLPNGESTKVDAAREAFQRQSMNCCLFNGSQLECAGTVSEIEAKAIVQELNDNYPACIRFNPSLVTNHLIGGTCTAMSFQFLDDYFKIKKSCPDGADFQTHLFQKLKDVVHKFTSSSQEMRNRQAAFNTIEVVKSQECEDYKKHKMQALANNHALTIDWASNAINILDENESASELSSLPEGAFLLRILKLADNEKLEENGHSLVFIKENGFHLFYDPNFGATMPSPTSYIPLITANFAYNFSRFNVNDARFYRVAPSHLS